MKERKGFTLVELLAVIVILAIIMIIAIPSVLETMEMAKRKSFSEFILKAYTNFQKQYVNDVELGVVKVPSGTVSVYYTLDDIGLNNTGSYYGYFEIIFINDPDVCVWFNSEHLSKECSGTFMTVTIMDGSSNLDFNLAGRFNDKFETDINKVTYFKNFEETSSYYSEHGYFPDSMYIGELECKQDELIDHLNQEVSRRNGEMGHSIRITELK